MAGIQYRSPRRKSEAGATMVLTAIFMVMLLGFVALSFDVGQMILVKHKLISIADAAARAGGLALGQQSTAIAAALAVTQANGIPPSDTTVTDSGGVVTVTIQKTVNTTFACVLGISSLLEKATTQVGPSGPIHTLPKGCMPWSIQLPTDDNSQAYFVVGGLYQLKSGSQSDPPGARAPGNFGALALGGPGASTYRSDLENDGYQSPLSVGDTVETEPGDMDGPTQQGLDAIFNAAAANPKWANDTASSFLPDDPRLVMVPITGPLGNGRSSTTILGFAAFFLASSSNESEVDGTFESLVIPNAVTGTDTNYGVTGLKFLR